MEIRSRTTHPVTRNIVVEVYPLPRLSATSLNRELAEHVSSTYLISTNANQANTVSTIVFADVNLACWELSQAGQLADLVSLLAEQTDN
jgi:hypothetical protein